MAEYFLKRRAKYAKIIEFFWDFMVYPMVVPTPGSGVAQ
jgi:hypothetical protein